VKRLLIVLLLAVVTILSPLRAGAQGTPAACPATTSALGSPSPVAGGAEGQIDQVIRAQAEARILSGSVLVAQNGEVVLEAGYGLADRKCQIPNDAGTTFRIGSITKQFTAAAIMQLVEAGKLSLDDPVTKHLSDFPTPIGSDVPITIRHLLTHTSGIPDFFAFYERALMGSWPSVREIAYEVVREQTLLFEPGTRFEYSNTGYFVLGLVIEAVSAESYEHYVHAHLFDLAGMTRSGFEGAGDVRPDPAIGYRGAGVFDVSSRYRMDIPWSAGGIFSTVGDLHRWSMALTDGRLISPESLSEMETPYLDNYGFGLFEGDSAGHAFIGHTGGIDGFISADVRFREGGIELIVLMNQESGGIAFEPITEAVFAALAPS
jgi:CubicO group peptidase (beta-lactamase class C family)